MARNLNRLTAKEVASAGPGVHQDGGGLRLLVTDSGAKRWALRMTLKGERIDVGLGSASTVTLAEARRKAADARAKAEEGADPRGHAASTIVIHRMTFREAAEAMLDHILPGYRNEKHKQQWGNTLATYVYPIIGHVAVADVGSEHALAVLSPIWLSKPETARRVRQRIGRVCDWAVAAGHRPSHLANPAAAVKQGLARQPRKSDGHEAMPWKEVPAFVQAIRSSPFAPSVRLGLEFTILTAARTGEVLGAQWDEMDLDAAVWTVPADRMKAGKAHRVPLSIPALAVVTAAQRLRVDETPFVFPGRKGPLSQMALLMATRRLTGGSTTVHGFRSSFRDWCADNGQSRELAEAALAHTLGKVEGAYRRSDLLEARRPLMEQWAAFSTRAVRLGIDPPYTLSDIFWSRVVHGARAGAHVCC